jgi:hypothetical protein
MSATPGDTTAYRQQQHFSPAAAFPALYTYNDPDAADVATRVAMVSQCIVYCYENIIPILYPFIVIFN